MIFKKTKKERRFPDSDINFQTPNSVNRLEQSSSMKILVPCLQASSIHCSHHKALQSGVKDTLLSQKQSVSTLTCGGFRTHTSLSQSPETGSTFPAARCTASVIITPKVVGLKKKKSLRLSYMYV